MIFFYPFCPSGIKDSTDCVKINEELSFHFVRQCLVFPHRQRDLTNNQITNMKPTTLLEIRNAAASMFNDKAVISVNIEASFGIVTVLRDGTIIML